jgi:ketosteroid isomerase-like protein
VRVTICCRKSDDRWLITQEHVSVPTDFETGRAVLDLAP